MGPSHSLARARRAVAVLFVGALAVLPLAGSPLPSYEGSPVAAQNPNGPPFHIKGEVTGLFPGVSRWMRVVLTNQGSDPVTATLIKVSNVEADPSRPSCFGKYLSATRWTGAVEIESGSRLTLPDAIRISLDPRAPNSCLGATFRLTYSGRGT